MDVTRMIAVLRAERERLDGIIVALERLQAEASFLAAPKRRGRKFMDKKARTEVSERMKRYWAERRKRAEGERQEDPVDEGNLDPKPQLVRSNAA